MSQRSLSNSTLRFGIILGIAAAALIVLGPFINGNFGVGGLPASTRELGGASVGVAVTSLYSILTGLCLPFSAALVGASLVMRHNDRLAADERTGSAPR